MAKAVNKNGTSALEYANITQLIKADLKVTSVADLEIRSKTGDTLLHSNIKQKNVLKS